MKLGILGAGRMGATLGRIWAGAGHDVTFAYARDAAKLDRLAGETGGRAGTVADAVAGADAVLLAVPWDRVEDVLDQAGDMGGLVALNCCVPLDDGDALVFGPDDSGAEDLARRRPGARWVACFNTTPSESLAPVFARKGRMTSPHVMTYGDDAGAKETAFRLIRDAGFDPLDTGGLGNARFVEPFAMATVELAYLQPGGPALTYRFDKLDT